MKLLLGLFLALAALFFILRTPDPPTNTAAASSKPVATQPVTRETDEEKQNRELRNSCASIIRYLERKPLSSLSMKDLQQLDFCRAVSQ